MIPKGGNVSGSLWAVTLGFSCPYKKGMAEMVRILT
jgi:hypothetical protein